LAAMLVLGVDADAVLSKLSCDTTDDHLAVLHETRADLRADPIPARGITRIGVGGDAFHRRLRAERAVAAVEPEVILLDRAAERAAGVVGVDDAWRLGQVRVQRPELVRQVLAARPPAGEIEEHIA